MILGFTGPRTGTTTKQRLWLTRIFEGHNSLQFHHGACIGADATAHWLAIDAGAQLIVVHPPVNTKTMMDLEIPLSGVVMVRNRAEYDVGNSHVIIMPAKGYHDRDRDIVDAADRMLSTPAGEPTPHSGTWFTINYALSQHKPISLCYPDGEEDEL